MTEAENLDKDKILILKLLWWKENFHHSTSSSHTLHKNRRNLCSQKQWSHPSSSSVLQSRKMASSLPRSHLLWKVSASVCVYCSAVWQNHAWWVVSYTNVSCLKFFRYIKWSLYRKFSHVLFYLTCRKKMQKTLKQMICLSFDSQLSYWVKTEIETLPSLFKIKVLAVRASSSYRN